ncbi:PilZ domain-containing protein [Candidatus Magnetaquicoccus inordinatus]|uniref:PilZ domain-containing protein n=1 Tax=Candidatus Magnetaquicoccus inordinatus TaxID=2496818 RepID=UPI00187D38D5|nr:PilZ domain-containing protein [Candidatus Magnetaquicoccus inordinatus]
MTDSREKARYTHNKNLRLLLSDDRSYYGSSRDVSLTGLFFIPESDDIEVIVGERGTLYLRSGEDTHSFACQIVRKTLEGLAIQITDNPAKFGMAISHDVFHSMLHRMREKDSSSS